MKPQKFLGRVVVLFGCLFVPTWIIIAQDSTHDLTAAELLKRIDKLEKRIEELEQKVQGKPKFILSQPLPEAVPTYPLYPQSQTLPPNARPRDFNGIRYYDILLNGQQSRSAVAIPQTSSTKTSSRPSN